MGGRWFASKRKKTIVQKITPKSSTGYLTWILGLGGAAFGDYKAYEYYKEQNAESSEEAKPAPVTKKAPAKRKSTRRKRTAAPKSRTSPKSRTAPKPRAVAPPKPAQGSRAVIWMILFVALLFLAMMSFILYQTFSGTYDIDCDEPRETRFSDYASGNKLRFHVRDDIP